MAPIIAELRASGAISLRGIAAALNERRVPTPNGYGEWKAEQVSRLLRRLKPDGLARAAARKGGRPPFGYKSVDGRLVKNDDERAALARMAALRDQGATLRAISLAIARNSGGQ